MAERDEILLVEYQCAQQTAHHHDTLLWTVTSIIWGANLVLIGFVLDALSKPSTGVVLVFVSILGIALTLVVAILMWINNWAMREDFTICQEIERDIPMLKQAHVRAKEKYPRFLQRGLYLVVVALFLVFWGFVLGKANP